MNEISDEKPRPVRPLTPNEQAAERRKKLRDELDAIAEGQVVCELGRGTANLIHKHWRVTGVTKIYIKHQLGNHISDPVSRFRREDGRSVPYSGYGGSQIRPYCQRPKPKEAS